MAKELPTYERQESIKPVIAGQGFSKASQQYAEQNNLLGSIGAQVAQVTSQQLATELGYEAGKNPHGNLLPPITEFDKSFVDSYNTQAQASLTLQGNELLSKADLEMGKATRITPQLIASTNNQVKSGLAKIAEQAPIAIKGNLEYNFANALQNSNYQYQNKMITQQREDQKNTLVAALQDHAKQAYKLGSAGNATAALSLSEQTKTMAQNAVNARLITPQQAQVITDSVRKSAVSSIAVNGALAARQEGKLAQYKADFAKKKPDWMTHEEWQYSAQAISNEIGVLENLQNQDQQIRSQQMLNSIASDPTGITGSMWQDFESSVRPEVAERIKHTYIQALKSANKSKKENYDLVQGWTDPKTHARMQPNEINKTFDNLVDATMKGDPNKTRDQAEIEVANASGGKVPAFQQSIRNKISSGNPQEIESAAQQIHELQSIEGEHALNGLGEEYKAAAAKYEALRSVLNDPTKAAQQMINDVFNQSSLEQKLVKEQWSSLLSKAVKSGKTHQDFALNLVGTNKDNFLNSGSAVMAASIILENYNSQFLTTKGDQEVSAKLTKQFYKENFGQSWVNGGDPKETLHPIEKVLGYKSNDVVPYIHQDLINQLNEKFQVVKDNPSSTEYFEVVPQDARNFKETIGGTYPPVKVRHHLKKQGKETIEDFDVVLQGNAFDSWDVALNSKSGLRNIFQIAPYLGITTYQPNKEFIDKSYQKDNFKRIFGL